MSDSNHIDQLVSNTKEYLETRVELVKLQMIEKGSEMSGAVVANLTFIFLFMIVLSFFSIAAALYLGVIWGAYYYGFLFVGACYLAVCLLLYFNKESWIKRPVSNTIIKAVFKENDHD